MKTSTVSVLQIFVRAPETHPETRTIPDKQGSLVTLANIASLVLRCSGRKLLLSLSVSVFEYLSNLWCRVVDVV